VLPFLLGDKLVARVDLKAERKQARLHVLSSIEEPGADSHHVAIAWRTNSIFSRQWLGLEEVAVADRGGLQGR